MFRDILWRAPCVNQREFAAVPYMRLSLQAFANAANGQFRRVSPVAAGFGEGPLTEQIAGVQRARREQVFVLP